MTTVNYIPDPKKKTQLTEEQEAKLAAISDEDIDYSDIEELDDDFWNNAKPVTNDLLSELSPSDNYIEVRKKIREEKRVMNFPNRKYFR